MNRNFFYLCFILLFSFSGVSHAQSNSYPKIQKLLDQTKGKPILKNIFEKKKLVGQSITSNSFKLTVKDDLLGQVTTYYMDVPWESKFEIGCNDVKDNKNLIKCSLYFEKDFTYFYYFGEVNDDEASKTSSLTMYLVKKDKVRDEFFDYIRPFRKN